MARSFKEAFEKASKDFAIYALSVVAALSLNNAISNMDHYKQRRWVTTIVIVAIAIGLLAIITYMDPDDGDNGE